MQPVKPCTILAPPAASLFARGSAASAASSPSATLLGTASSIPGHAWGRSMLHLDSDGLPSSPIPTGLPSTGTSSANNSQPDVIISLLAPARSASLARAVGGAGGAAPLSGDAEAQLLPEGEPAHGPRGGSDGNAQ